MLTCYYRTYYTEDDAIDKPIAVKKFKTRNQREAIDVVNEWNRRSIVSYKNGNIATPLYKYIITKTRPSTNDEENDKNIPFHVRPCC